MIDNITRINIINNLKQIDCSKYNSEKMDNGNGRELLCGHIAEALGVGFAPYYFDADALINTLINLIKPDVKNNNKNKKE